MKRSIFGLIGLVLIVSLAITPFTVATPGDEKNNEKFEYFELVCSGSSSGEFDSEWWTSMVNLEDANKTYHARGVGWVTGDTVALTVGSDIYTMTTTPVNVTWTTTYDIDTIRNNTGAIKRVNIRLTDVVEVYDNNIMIGTLVLELKSSIVPTAIPVYSGTLVGYGTDDLKGVHISGIDIGVIGPQLFMRNGTITGWPF